MTERPDPPRASCSRPERSPRLAFERARLSRRSLPPTPACHDGDEPTVRQTEGPFFKPRSPQRADLRERGSRRRCRSNLTGLVLTRRCQPVAGALVDLWHADDKGDYDNSGFRYRGHQFTDAQGRYRFRTIRPAVYTGPHRALSRQGAGAGRPHPDHAALFPERAGQPRATACSAANC